MNDLRKNLYDYDTRLREKLLPIRTEYMSNPYTIYGIDLVASDHLRRNKNSVNYLKPVELQVCTTWKFIYPYDNIYIFERKRKYLYSDCFIWLFNRTFDFYFQLDTSTLNDPNIYKSYNQKFNKYIYAIPIHLCTLHWIDGTPKLLSLCQPYGI